MNSLQAKISINSEYQVDFTQQEVINWLQWLILNEKSKNTIVTYKYSVKMYVEKYGYILSKLRVMDFKKYYLNILAAKTVNLRLVGLNNFIQFLAQEKENPKILDLKVKQTKIHQRTTVENVITTKEFNKLLEYVKGKNGTRDPEKWYWIIKTLGYTGVRVSELVQLKVEDLIQYGIFKVHGKGDKCRDILVPDKFKKELLKYISDYQIQGFLFKNKDGEQITTRGVAHKLYQLGQNAGVPFEHCHPHSFRHMYALNLLEATKDLTFVSNMLGHSKIETTAVYLRMSLDKQKNIINKKVNW